MRPARLLVLALLPLSALATSPAPLSRADAAWLRRDGFDLSADALARYRALGRQRLLDEQLRDRIDDDLPPSAQATLNSFEALRTPVAELLANARQQQRQIKAMPDGPAKVAARKALRIHARQWLMQARQAELLHALYGRNQLKEQMVWFWLNHFSVYGNKGLVKVAAADYEENVIRPHALGRFRDLVMATLESPAMLAFLDNAQNARGKVNENYARELMELHILGVHGGYSQQDVQQLALILTGAGIAPARLDGRPLPRRFAGNAVRHGAFLFNPMRHDFRDKTLLGHTIRGSGFDEIEQAVTLLTRQRACADFISRELARYFVADRPPAALVQRMADTFQRTDGDIAAVLRTMFDDPALLDRRASKFKDPMQFVVSAVRLAHDGQPIVNALPMVNWLKQMGEPLFGRVTPDGWPLDGASWSSSGQMAKRFDIARAIGTGANALMTPPGDPRGPAPAPELTGAVYDAVLAPRLSPATRAALAQARSSREWNTYLLASPDFNYR